MNPRIATATAAVILFVLFAALFSASNEGDEKAAIAVPATAPAYCGTAATAGLPECGWTEQRQAASDKQKISPYCKQTEDGIRELWNATIWDHQSHRIRDDAEHTRVVAELVRSAETLCQESRDRESRQLPAELQKLAR